MSLHHVTHHLRHGINALPRSLSTLLSRSNATLHAPTIPKDRHTSAGNPNNPAPGTYPPVGPYSQVTSVDVGTGRLVTLSGLIGMTQQGKFDTTDPAAQTEQILQHASSILHHIGGTPNNITRVGIFTHEDLSAFDALNERYAKFFDENGVTYAPVRSTVGVAELPKAADGARVEMDFLAFIPHEKPSRVKSAMTSKKAIFALGVATGTYFSCKLGLGDFILRWPD